MEALWDGLLFGFGLVISLSIGVVIVYMRWKAAVQDRDYLQSTAARRRIRERG